MSWSTDDPKLASEVATRVVAGIAKLARAFVPTYENGDGKKVHHAVPVLEGVLYVGTDRALGMAAVRLRPAEMCKKKSAARDALAAGHPVSALVSYPSAAAWLKLHGKGARFAEVGERGLSLAVGPGVAAYSSPLTREGRLYAEGVRRTIAERVDSAAPRFGPFPLPEFPAGADSAVLVLGEGGASASPGLRANIPEFQLRMKPKALAVGPGSECWGYDDPLGGRIVRIRTEAPGYAADLYFRVLAV